METPDGQVLDLFGKGGAETAARRLNLPFLGALPMYPELRVNSDRGTPEDNFTTNPKLKSALESIVTNLAAQVIARNTQGAGPQLTIS